MIMHKQMLVTSVKFNFQINMWESVFENTITVYSRYQPFYTKGDVIKKYEQTL